MYTLLHKLSLSRVGCIYGKNNFKNIIKGGCDMQQEKVNEKIIIESKKEVNDMNDNVIINENSLMNTPECTREEDTRKIIQDILKLPFKEWMAHYPEDYFRVVKTLAYGKPDLTDEQCSVKSFTTAEIFGYLFDRKQKIEEDHIVITDSYIESLADCTQRMVKPITYCLYTKRYLTAEASVEVDKLLTQLLADRMSSFADFSDYKDNDNIYHYQEQIEQIVTYSLALLEALCKAASDFIH